MRTLTVARLWLRSLFRPGSVVEEINAELRDHIERQIEVNVAAGMSPEEARAAARHDFGNMLVLQEEIRDARGLNLFADLRMDLRHALRSMRRSPMFTTVAVFTLALGIGANTAIFSLLHTVVLRPLPVAEPDRLLLVDAEEDGRPSIISYPMYRDLVARQQVFSSLIACRDYYTPPLRLRLGNGAAMTRAVRGGLVSGDYFAALGLVPARGRLLFADDDRPGAPAQVAVVSYAFWQRELGAAADVVGRPITINEAPFTIVGVAPAGFTGLSKDSSIEIWLPLTQFRSARELANRGGTFFRLVGRLKPGSATEQAQAALTALFRQLKSVELSAVGNAAPRPGAFRIVLQPGGRGFAFFRERLEKTLVILMTMSAVLMVIVCMNVATLLSVHTIARAREIAVRQTLGASRGRVLRQFVTENLLLSTMAGMLGMVFAVWADRVLLRFISTEIALHSAFSRYVPDALQSRLDLRTLAFAESAALVAGVIVAVVAARPLNRPDLLTRLRDRSARLAGPSMGPRRVPVRKVTVAAQVALSVVLLLAAGLLGRTIVNLRHVDAGFDARNVLLVDLDVGTAARSTAEWATRVRTLGERLRQLPGVRSASLSWISLFSDSDLRMRIAIEGGATSSSERLTARMDVVSPAYFETVGMRLTMGRGFSPRDDTGAPAVVNEAFVRRFLQGRNPLGMRFALGAPDSLKEIIGVVRDAKYNDLREGSLEMFFLPLLQAASPPRSIQVRTVGPPLAMVEPVRAIVMDAAPDIAITDVKSLREQVDRTLVRELLLADLSGFFAGAGLILVCLGLYSVLAYHVSQRTPEIGVRMALGSSRWQVVWLVLGEAIGVVVIGLAAGIGTALLMSQSVRAIVFGVAPTDPATIAAVSAALLLVASLASYVPARRASRIDPARALNAD